MELDLDAIVERHDPLGQLDQKTLASVRKIVAHVRKMEQSCQSIIIDALTETQQHDAQEAAPSAAPAQGLQESSTGFHALGLTFTHDIFSEFDSACKHCGAAKAFPGHDGASRCIEENYTKHQAKLAAGGMATAEPTTPRTVPSTPVASPSPATRSSVEEAAPPAGDLMFCRKCKVAFATACCPGNHANFM